MTITYFNNLAVQADIVHHNSVQVYLARKLNETLDFPYVVKAKRHTQSDQFLLSIIETEMTSESYVAFTNFMHEHRLTNDLDVLIYFLKEDAGFDCEFFFTCSNMENVCIVRRKK